MSSFIWKIFVVDESDQTKAKCLLCNKKFTRGSTPKTFSTSPLHKHAQMHHRNQYEEAKNGENDLKEATGPSPKQRKLEAMSRQLNIEEKFQNKKHWDMDDPRSKAIHEKLFKMIVVDNQPFSMVEDQGFIEYTAHLKPHYLSPGRKYLNEMLPNQFHQIEKQIK